MSCQRFWSNDVIEKLVNVKDNKFQTNSYHPFFNLTAIIRDVVQKRFEVYNKLEEATRLALEQEAAAKAAEERKKAEEMAAKADEQATTKEKEAEGDDGGSERATTADTPAESGQNEDGEEE